MADECCFFFAVDKCRFRGGCRLSHDPAAVFPYLDRIVCKRMVEDRTCPGCDKHHSGDVTRAYIRHTKMAAAAAVKKPVVEKAVLATPVVEAAVKFPTAADMAVEDVVQAAPKTMSVEDQTKELQEELRPKGKELAHLQKQLRENPYWAGEVFVEFTDTEINTPAVLERCLQLVRDDIGLPCYVSIVRTGDVLGVYVKHPKIFVNR
jgi:hypothetical protein